MKLATERTGDADGRLLVVSRDLQTCIDTTGIADTMLEAVEKWETVERPLQSLYGRLCDGELHGRPLSSVNLAAPLPRTWQWLDGSAYTNHGDLMAKAFGHDPLPTNPPLMYQGMSHRFLAGDEDVPLPSEQDGIDFEGEIGVITGRVPMRASAEDALNSIRLIVQINDWSLRAVGAQEMRTGFGWLVAKPACSVAPIAITPDELGSAWNDGRVNVRIRVELNGQRFGDVPSTGMQYGFHELIAHGTRSRELSAGTIVGSGTVSSPDYQQVGSCCIAERRAIESIEQGSSATPYMHFGDRILMAAYVGDGPVPLFGTIDQRVVQG